MRRGFSLIEVLVVLALAVGVVLVVSSFRQNTTVLDNLLNVGLQSKSDVGQAIEIMTNEIRSAQPSENGAFAIDSASTSSFAFYSGVDGNGSVEHVRYFLATSSIMKGVIQPTSTPVQYPTSTEVVTDVVDGVKIATGTPLFAYYGVAYTGTQSALTPPFTVSQIGLVGVSFTVQVVASGSPTSTTPYSFLVDLRNLRTND